MNTVPSTLKNDDGTERNFWTVPLANQKM